MKVELQNGIAVLKDICPLRVSRTYEKAVIAAMDDNAKVTDIEGVNNAQFALTLKLIESVTIGDKTVTGAEITEDWLLDNIGSKDYDLIEDAAGTVSGKWETKPEREKKRKLAKKEN